ncbi:MAG: hypothetical protein ACETWC_03910 [Acidobacteriota bacterium]
MLDVKSAIYSLLTVDATLQSQLGGDATDKRIHFWYPEEEVLGEIELSDSKPAYITYYEGPSGEPHISLENERYVFDIWSLKPEVLEQVFTTLDGLLHNKELTCDNHWNILTRRIHKEDSGRDVKGIYSKNVIYLVKVVKK